MLSQISDKGLSPYSCGEWSMFEASSPSKSQIYCYGIRSSERDLVPLKSIPDGDLITDM
jgi:hypothetical protein